MAQYAGNVLLLCAPRSDRREGSATREGWRRARLRRQYRQCRRHAVAFALRRVSLGKGPHRPLAAARGPALRPRPCGRAQGARRGRLVGVALRAVDGAGADIAATMNLLLALAA